MTKSFISIVVLVFIGVSFFVFLVPVERDRETRAEVAADSAHSVPTVVSARSVLPGPDGESTGIARFGEDGRNGNVVIRMESFGSWNIPLDLTDIRWPIEASIIDGTSWLPHIEMSALPGVSGFEVMAYRFSDGNPSEAYQLAQEIRDNDWAAELEARLLSEISQTRRALVAVYVECRQTICGILYVFPSDSRGDLLGQIDDDFARENGFRGVISAPASNAASGTFTALYLVGRTSE